MASIFATALIVDQDLCISTSVSPPEDSFGVCFQTVCFGILHAKVNVSCQKISTLVLEVVTVLDPLGSTSLPSGFSDVLKLAEVKDHRSSMQACLVVLPGVGTCITLWTSVKFPEQLQEWEED